jgi:hypothetical protein
MIHALLISTLLFASPSSSPAASGTTRPRPGSGRLLQAQTEFSRGDFAAAMRSLDAARAEVPDDYTLARVELLDGQIRSAQRDPLGADASFTRALERDPEIRLDPDRVDPDLVKQLETLRGGMKGELSVSADMPAKVLVNGKPLGSAPARTTLPIGRHTVVVQGIDNPKTSTQEVVVRANIVNEVPVTLAALPDPVGPSGVPELGGMKPYADVRVGIDPLHYTQGVAFEVGGGVEGRYLRASLSARVFPEFGLTPRGALTVPVTDSVRGYVALELPTLFMSRIAFGLGGSGGAELILSPWLAAYAEVGGRHFFFAPTNFDLNRLTVQSGLRLRVP